MGQRRLVPKMGSVLKPCMLRWSLDVASQGTMRPAHGSLGCNGCNLRSCAGDVIVSLCARRWVRAGGRERSMHVALGNATLWCPSKAVRRSPAFAVAYAVTHTQRVCQPSRAIRGSRAFHLTRRKSSTSYAHTCSAQFTCSLRS